MDTREALVRINQRQVDSLFNTAHLIPADKLEWVPGPGNRSALSQLQECATVVDKFWGTHADRKMTYNPAVFAQWLEERSQITALDELEARTRDGMKRLCEWILAMDPEDLTKPVDMPFPGEHLVLDVVQYHAWNMAYHEGQLNYILQQLELPGPFGG